MRQYPVWGESGEQERYSGQRGRAYEQRLRGIKQPGVYWGGAGVGGRSAGSGLECWDEAC